MLNCFFIAILCNLIEIAKKFERYINKMEDVINRPIPLGTIVKGTILYGAAFWGANSATLDYLLRLGANPNIVDIAGQTPLHIAITRLNTEISPSDEDKQLSEQENFNKIKILINATNLTIADKFGNTPLHYIMYKKNCDLFIPHLLANGSKSSQKNKAGKSAIHFHELSDKMRKKIKLWLDLADSIDAIENYGLQLKNEEPDFQNETLTRKKSRAMIDLAQSLRKKMATLEINKPDSNNNKSFVELLHSQDNLLGAPRGWKTIIANVGLCLAGLGIIYLTAGFIHLAATRGQHFLFFSNTASQNKQRHVDHCIEKLTAKM